MIVGTAGHIDHGKTTLVRALTGTDTDAAPWTTIKSNDKKRARINAMRFFLNQFDYEGRDDSVVTPPDPLIVSRGIDTVGD